MIKLVVEDLKFNKEAITLEGLLDMNQDRAKEAEGIVQSMLSQIATKNTNQIDRLQEIIENASKLDEDIQAVFIIDLILFRMNSGE